MRSNHYETIITIWGVELPAVVSYDYSPAERGSWDHPEIDAEIEVTEVKIAGQVADLDDMDADALEDLEDRAREDAEERARSRRREY
jgi:hypothetical protein